MIMILVFIVIVQVTFMNLWTKPKRWKIAYINESYFWIDNLSESKSLSDAGLLKKVDITLQSRTKSHPFYLNFWRFLKLVGRLNWKFYHHAQNISPSCFSAKVLRLPWCGNIISIPASLMLNLLHVIFIIFF